MLLWMGACVFVASGLRFDVDGYLRTGPFKPATVFRRGETPRKETTPRPDSGFVVLLVEGAIAEQIDTARRFLKQHEEDFKSMRKHGVDNLLLNFGVERGWELEQTDHLPPELIAAMGQLGMGLAFSTVQLPRG